MLTKLLAQLTTNLHLAKIHPQQPTYTPRINFQFKISALATKLSMQTRKEKAKYIYAKLYLFMLLKEEYEMYAVRSPDFDLAFTELIDQCLQVLDFCALEMFGNTPPDYFVLKEDLKNSGFGRKFMFTIFE
ncbi:hypothetical protein HDV01_000476 [Terramyces sp. JEL0728]|nr:hypothetical protein HDV01_000476 [Terramyces sp. JEL0728]